MHILYFNLQETTKYRNNTHNWKTRKKKPGNTNGVCFYFFILNGGTQKIIKEDTEGRKQDAERTFGNRINTGPELGAAL